MCRAPAASWLAITPCDSMMTSARGPGRSVSSSARSPELARRALWSATPSPPPPPPAAASRYRACAPGSADPPRARRRGPRRRAPTRARTCGRSAVTRSSFGSEREPPSPWTAHLLGRMSISPRGPGSRGSPRRGGLGLVLVVPQRARVRVEHKPPPVRAPEHCRRLLADEALLGGGGGRVRRVHRQVAMRSRESRSDSRPEAWVTGARVALGELAAKGGAPTLPSTSAYPRRVLLLPGLRRRWAASARRCRPAATSRHDRARGASRCRSSSIRNPAAPTSGPGGAPAPTTRSRAAEVAREGRGQATRGDRGGRARGRAPRPRGCRRARARRARRTRCTRRSARRRRRGRGASRRSRTRRRCAATRARSASCSRA